MRQIQVYEGSLPGVLEADFQFCKVYTFQGQCRGPIFNHLNQANNYNCIIEANFARNNAVHELEKMVGESTKADDSMVELIADVVETRRETTMQSNRGEFTPGIVLTLQAIGYKRKTIPPV